MQIVRHLVVIIILAGVAVTSSRAAGEADPATSLAGTWSLNRSKSEMPRQPQGAFAGRGGRQGPGFEGGSGVGVGGARSAGRPGGRVDGPRGRMGGAETLRITVEGREIRLLTGEGRVRTVVIDGATRPRQRGLMEVTETAAWQDGTVVITSTAPDGPEVVETLAVAGDNSDQLVHTVRTRRPGSDGETSIRWVYDRRSGGSENR